MSRLLLVVCALAPLCAGGFDVHLPIGAATTLQCNLEGGTSLWDCAAAAVGAACGAEAMATEHCPYGGARHLLQTALEGLFRKSAGDASNTLAEGACGAGPDAAPCRAAAEPALSAALDAAGGYACGQGGAVSAGPRLASVLAALPPRARSLNATCGAFSAADAEAYDVIVVDGAIVGACDVGAVLEAALVRLAPRGTLVVRGAAPCASDGVYGATWAAVARLGRRDWVDVALGVFDGGIAFVHQRRARSPGSRGAVDGPFDDARLQRVFSTFQNDFESIYPMTLGPDALLASRVSQRGDGDYAGAASCGPAERDAVASLWADHRASVGFQDVWEYTSLLGCPEKAWLRPILASHLQGTRNMTSMRQTAQPLIVVNVGANKGYSIAKLLSEVAPELAVTPAAWGSQLRVLGAKQACGWCRDCLDEGGETAAFIAGAPAQRGLVLDLHAIEPLGANVRLLQSVLEAFGFRAAEGGVWTLDVQGVSARVTLHAVAASDSDRSALFPALAAGEEVGGLCDEFGDSCADVFHGYYDPERLEQLERVQVRSLDSLFPDLRIDLLLVDVEGADPDVLKGAAKMLVGRRVAFVEFENHFRGAWAVTALKDVVSDVFEARGFDCYLQGAHSALWPLSRGCWHANYDVKVWSNVACLARSEQDWHHVLDRHVVRGS
ncbi:hypothetical protein M885DRAFT_531460 [Pelagophyceae sp. CCMP2097]|nr:hypothetical protein M885DRAFT_531460 [Pelagophyceae sp. CCMP2097]